VASIVRLTTKSADHGGQTPVLTCLRPDTMRVIMAAATPQGLNNWANPPKKARL